MEWITSRVAVKDITGITSIIGDNDPFMPCKQTADRYIMTVCYKYTVVLVRKFRQYFQIRRGKHEDLLPHG